MKQRLQNAITAIQGHEIPELPEEVLLLEKEIQSKFTNIQDIANIIERNTSLSGEVIRLINSPVMQLKLHDPVHSIKEAVTILGLTNIYNLLVASALKNLFNSKGLMQDILSQSVDVAFCMAEISEHVQGISRDEAYMLGLFHNAGALMLASMDEKGYEKIYTHSLSHPVSFLIKEQAHFNTTHTMVGVLVSKKWHLPTTMINAIMTHHNKTCKTIKNDDVRTMVAMLKISNAVVAEISLGAYCSAEMRHDEKDGSEELMLSSKQVTSIRTNLISYSHKDH